MQEEASKFSKWISRGKLEDFTPAARVRMWSLSDLVNAAIDMNARAIYDGGEKGVYFVVHECVLYYFDVDEGKEEESNLPSKNSGKP